MSRRGGWPPRLGPSDEMFCGGANPWSVRLVRTRMVHTPNPGASDTESRATDKCGLGSESALGTQAEQGQRHAVRLPTASQSRHWIPSVGEASVEVSPRRSEA